MKNRIVVAGIVGPKKFSCVTECPSAQQGIDCSATLGCPNDCSVVTGSNDGFCADQVYNTGQAKATCTSLNGQAFNGRRYIDLINAFGKSGTEESICAEASPTGEFSTALVSIARIVKDIFQLPFCLTRPLFPCSSQEACGDGFNCLGLDSAGGGQASEGEGEAAAAAGALDISPYCGNPQTGLPAGALIQVLTAVDPETGEGGDLRAGPGPTYTFSPGTGPGGYGCFQFVDNPPGPGETIQFLYRAGIVIDG